MFMFSIISLSMIIAVLKFLTTLTSFIGYWPLLIPHSQMLDFVSAFKQHWTFFCQAVNLLALRLIDLLLPSFASSGFHNSLFFFLHFSVSLPVFLFPSFLVSLGLQTPLFASLSTFFHLPITQAVKRVNSHSGSAPPLARGKMPAL